MRLFFKISITMVSILGLILGVSLIIISVFDISTFAPIGQEEARTYTYSFVDMGKVVYRTSAIRGDDTDFSNVPVIEDSVGEDGTEYYYKGWDWTGDGLVDHSFPKKAYFSFEANAVYRVVKPATSSSEEISESSGGEIDG